MQYFHEKNCKCLVVRTLMQHLPRYLKQLKKILLLWQSCTRLQILVSSHSKGRVERENPLIERAIVRTSWWPRNNPLLINRSSEILFSKPPRRPWHIVQQLYVALKNCAVGYTMLLQLRNDVINCPNSWYHQKNGLGPNWLVKPAHSVIYNLRRMKGLWGMKVGFWSYAAVYGSILGNNWLVASQNVRQFVFL